MGKVMWRGRQVPWITRWSSERILPGPKLVPVPDPQGPSRWRLSFADVQDSDLIDGVLWLRENDSQGVGDPMFKDVHSHRQRRCMIEGLCQVCGTKITPPYLWLIPPNLSTRSGAGMVTDVAPVCDGCVDVAMSRCPLLDHVRARVKLFSVTDYRPVAVFGDMLRIQADQRFVHLQADVPLAKPEIRHVMARQMVVELWNFRRQRM